jgi:hypothetical protein
MIYIADNLDDIAVMKSQMDQAQAMIDEARQKFSGNASVQHELDIAQMRLHGQQIDVQRAKIHLSRIY